jgi:ABC-type sugar transport system permease subunit
MSKADMTNVVANNTWSSLGETAVASGTVANGLFSAMDLQDYLMNLSFSPALSGYVVSAVGGIFDIVNNSGVQMLIFLAGLQSISPSIYEASDIDGASGWETFWLVTFPMISPYILVNVFYTIVDSFTKSDNVIMQIIQEQSFKSNAMGMGAAMAWFYFLIVAICIAIIVAIISSYIYYQQRD